MNRLVSFGRIVLAVAIIAATFLPFRSFTIFANASTAASISSPFVYNFKVSGSLDETASADLSSSPYWWLSSGGRFILENGVGKTIHGALQTKDKWRTLYATTNPVATDAGYHPQNIFQMFLRTTWNNTEQSIYSRIGTDNLSTLENRHAWNGISLLSRYKDENTYYYAGIRMDGLVAIKKKVQGTHYTLATTRVFPGTYSASTNPNLLPKGTWIGIKNEVTTDDAGVVTLKLYLDTGKTGVWKLVAETRDDGRLGAPITGSGLPGIRSDFMDVEFDDYVLRSNGSASTVLPTPTPPPTDPAPTPSPAGYGLSSDRTVTEASSITASNDGAWWVNSGAYFTVANGMGKTVVGNLPTNDPWRTLYAANNPTDTDNGYHPQNIFRLVTKNSWQNFEQSGYFTILADNLSASSNRAEHNGLLFFNRYKDGNNLYYTGIRVDGRAVIKKKLNGTYYTMALTPVYSGTYNRTSNPNLIPHNKSIGLKSVVTTTASGAVSIKLYLDEGKTGNWKLIAEALDDGRFGAPITSGAHLGVRTDFMDISLQEYAIKPL